MINYYEIPENIDDEQRHNIEELNRVKEGLKNLVTSLINNGNDAEDIAEMCWHCGFEYATSYYIEEGMLSYQKNNKS